MGDRLTQLQDAINQQAENLCNSMGVLQQSESDLVPGAQPPNKEEMCNLFSTLIARTAKDIEMLIESLPSDEMPTEEQAEILKNLEASNDRTAEELRKAVERGEKLLERISEALHDIAQTQIAINNC